MIHPDAAPTIQLPLPDGAECEDLVAFLANNYQWGRGAVVCADLNYVAVLDAAPGLSLTLVDPSALIPEDGEGITLMQMEPIAAAVYTARHHLDFALVGGTQSFSVIIGHIATWLPKVKPGGMFLGQNINRPVVRRAVETVFGEFLISVDNTWGAPV